MRLEIDFGRRAGAFDHDDLVRSRQRVIALDDEWEEFLDASLVVIARSDLSPDFPLHDDLRAGVGGRLDQNGVHLDGRGHAARLGLQGLRATDFAPVDSRRGIQRHVLRLERRHAIAAIRQYAAQCHDDE